MILNRERFCKNTFLHNMLVHRFKALHTYRFCQIAKNLCLVMIGHDKGPPPSLSISIVSSIDDSPLNGIAFLIEAS